MAAPYALYFTGDQNPRGTTQHRCIMMGEDVMPIYYEFMTYNNHQAATTTIMFRNGNDNDKIAFLDWSHGVAEISNKDMHMEWNYTQGPNYCSRKFLSGDGRRYEWRRDPDPQGPYAQAYLYSYHLFTDENRQIASFFPIPQSTPVGPTYGRMEYCFTGLLLVEALLALCVNRWLDQPPGQFLH